MGRRMHGMRGCCCWNAKDRGYEWIDPMDLTHGFGPSVAYFVDGAELGVAAAAEVVEVAVLAALENTTYPSHPTAMAYSASSLIAATATVAVISTWDKRP